MKNTCVGASFPHVGLAGVSIGERAHHDPPLAGVKHSFSLNQECQSSVFQSLFPKRGVTVAHVLHSISRQTENSLMGTNKNYINTAYKYHNTEY